MSINKLELSYDSPYNLLVEVYTIGFHGQNQSMKKQGTIIFLLAGIGQFTLDSPIPSLPTLVHDLNSTISHIQLMMGFFIISMAITQPIYGVFSDTYGRKPILFIGLVFLIFGSLICYFSSDYTSLIIGRIVQGIGIGATSALCKAIARDLYEADELKKIMSIIFVTWCIALLIAPLIGGVMQYYSGWKSVFLCQLFIQVLTLFICINIYRESQLETIGIRNILSSSNFTYMNKNFLTYTAICMLCTFFIYGFNLITPFLIQITFHYNPLQNGIFNFLITAGYVIGAFTNQKLKVNKHSEQLINQICLSLVGLSSTLAFFSLNYTTSFFLILSVIFIISCGVGFILPYSMAKAFNNVKNSKGLASSTYGLILFVGSFLCNLAISSFIGQNLFKFSLLMLLFSILLFLVARNAKNLSFPVDSDVILDYQKEL